jgi:hypothetical protein
MAYKQHHPSSEGRLFRGRVTARASREGREWEYLGRTDYRGTM